MKVLLTGATGYLGSHTAQALSAAGHQVRVLVRSREKAQRVLGGRGIPFELWPGDMTDAEDVGRALEGCEAVVHAAATVFGGEEVLDANIAGVRNVVGGAAQRRLDPVVYVSTIVSMFPPPGPVATTGDPVASLWTTYGRSKSEGERIARELQAEGAPVTIVYPGGIYGPDDPGFGETLKGLQAALRFGWPITSGGAPVVDVRDVARVITAALQPGRGPRRYLAGGHFLTWAEQADLCDRLTGVRARRLPAPPALLRGVGRLLDALKRLVPLEYPLTYEAALIMTQMKPCDSRRTCDDLGLSFRPSEETLGDSIRWLYREGHLPARHAGRLSRAPAALSPGAG
jgi:nucleoside-diphosphate-sugar epimerase